MQRCQGWVRCIVAPHIGGNTMDLVRGKGPCSALLVLL